MNWMPGTTGTAKTAVIMRNVFGDEISYFAGRAIEADYRVTLQYPPSLYIRIGAKCPLPPTSESREIMDDTYLVREVMIEDLDDFWSLRLKALRDHPEAYGGDYDASRASGPLYVQRGFFEGGINRIFAAFTADGSLIAQAGVYSESGKRSHIAHVVSVYTHPDHRGKGLATRLVQTCIDHLQECDEITSIRISVNSNNQPALRCYTNLGFVAWGEEPDAMRTSDGSCHNETHMVLTSGARRL